MTRYEQIAGTPERLAETFDNLCGHLGDCSECPLEHAPCELTYKLLEWLNEPAEDKE